MFTTLATSYPGGPAGLKTTAATPHSDATVLPLRIVTTPNRTPAEELRPDTSHGVARVGAGEVAVVYLVLLSLGSCRRSWTWFLWCQS